MSYRGKRSVLFRISVINLHLSVIEVSDKSSATDNSFTKKLSKSLFWKNIRMKREQLRAIHGQLENRAIDMGARFFGVADLTQALITIAICCDSND